MSNLPKASPPPSPALNSGGSDALIPELRQALGAFTTGVTIVTSRDAEGNDVGLTANSFSSVSLDPPMVSWSLSRAAQSLNAFTSAEYFAVHVLAIEQNELSQRFARRGMDKFRGLALSRGLGEIPLLEGCAARFECKTSYQYDGGDHVIFVGNVIHFEYFNRPPLVFHGGKYGFVLTHTQEALADAVAPGLTEQLLTMLSQLNQTMGREPVDDVFARISGSEQLVLAQLLARLTTKPGNQD